MKQIAILLGLMATFFMFAGCATKSTDQVAADQTGNPEQHDYKGEKAGK